MSVTVTGVAACRAELRAIEEFLQSERPMRGIVEEIRDGIKIKTALGKDYRGRGFAPYSKEYKKRKKGMTATGRPNLKVTGTMMDSVEARVIDASHGQVVVPSVSDGGIGADMLANIHNTGTGKQPQREFMNITLAAFKRLVKKYYDDKILEIVRRYR